MDTVANRYNHIFNEKLREAAKTMAQAIVTNCPDSRERSTALTYLDSAVFHATAAIARSSIEHGGTS